MSKAEPATQQPVNVSRERFCELGAGVERGPGLFDEPIRLDYAPRRKAPPAVGFVLRVACAAAAFGSVTMTFVALWPSVTTCRCYARGDLTQRGLYMLATPLETFRLHLGRYPTTQEGLNVLLIAPEGSDAGRWAGPYVKPVSFRDACRDAWGRNVDYKCPGVRNPASYDLTSPGPNGILGDGDDIGN